MYLIIPGEIHGKFLTMGALEGESSRLWGQGGFYFLLYVLLHCMDSFHSKTCITCISVAGESNSEW